MRARNNAPEAHDWKRVSSSVWNCPWCGAYTKGQKRPNPEARHSEDARLQAQALNKSASKAQEESDGK